MVIALSFLSDLLISRTTLKPKEQWGSQVNESNLLLCLINDPYFGAWFPLHHISLLLWLFSMLGQKIVCQLHCHLLLCILPSHLPPREILTSLSLPFLLSRYFKSSSYSSFLFLSATVFGHDWVYDFPRCTFLFYSSPCVPGVPNCTMAPPTAPKTDVLWT